LLLSISKIQISSKQTTNNSKVSDNKRVFLLLYINKEKALANQRKTALLSDTESEVINL
jgi:hypothetical protein